MLLTVILLVGIGCAIGFFGTRLGQTVTIGSLTRSQTSALCIGLSILLAFILGGTYTTLGAILGYFLYPSLNTRLPF
ncbi:MAG: hypothetical protein IAF58_05450 [Leptolyngbya sp.]|nr:hypothetical protein [Candidatus Melainabacteria bacterium]